MNEKKKKTGKRFSDEYWKNHFFTNGFASFLFFFCLLVSFQDSFGEMKIFYLIF